MIRLVVPDLTGAIEGELWERRNRAVEARDDRELARVLCDQTWLAMVERDAVLDNLVGHVRLCIAGAELGPDDEHDIRSTVQIYGIRDTHFRRLLARARETADRVRSGAA